MRIYCRFTHDNLFGIYLHGFDFVFGLNGVAFHRTTTEFIVVAKTSKKGKCE